MNWLEQQADKMRRNPTGIEIFIHNLLDREGFEFEFQKPIMGRFIVDFFIPPDIVIEVDGPHHDKRKEADAKRDELMATKGLHVLRLCYKRLNFGAEYSSDYSFIWNTIKEFLQSIAARSRPWRA